MALLLALLSSVLWGIADFAGGTASRRLSSLVVVWASQAIGLLAAIVTAVAVGEFAAPIGYLPWAVGAGIVGASGLLAFYHALAIGTMGIVSPIAALGVVVPVLVGFVTGQWPSAVVGLGIVLAIIGVVAASGPERAAGRSLRPMLLACVAALCFGLTLLFIARGARYSSLMTMVGMRATSAILLGGLVAAGVLRRARRRRVAAPPTTVDDGESGGGSRRNLGLWCVVATAGVFDVGANLTFAIASTWGALAIVAILGSLYPAVTVVLARLIHAERLGRIQHVGVLVALVGVALIAGWS